MKQGSDSIGNLSIAEKVHVLIAHSDAIVSAGLAMLLATQADVHISSAGAESDVIILDYRSAMEYLRGSAAAFPSDRQPRVMIVTQMNREVDVSAAMTAGVHGYLLQNAGSEQLLIAVRALSKGKHYVSEELTHWIDDSADRICLTSREADVLRLLAQGLCNKSIARELGIGIGTVKTHVKGLFNKLGATARTHAVVLALRRGLVDSTE